MYAIVRKGDGKFYTSMVFGYYTSPNKKDYKESSFWIVLNEEKTALIKQHTLQQNTNYLIPMVLITDADETNWIKCSDYAHSVDFLPADKLLSMIENHLIPEELTSKCIEMDRRYVYEPIRAINTPADIRDLEWASGGFHDAHIAEIKKDHNSIYILFEGTWGCKVEVWFEGEAACDTTCKDPEIYDPYWYSSTVTIENGFIYLIDEENVSAKDITPDHCWFKAKSMKYKVIPD